MDRYDHPHGRRRNYDDRDNISRNRSGEKRYRDRRPPDRYENRSHSPPYKKRRFYRDERNSPPRRYDRYRRDDRDNRNYRERDRYENSRRRYSPKKSNVPNRKSSTKKNERKVVEPKVNKKALERIIKNVKTNNIRVEKERKEEETKERLHAYVNREIKREKEKELEKGQLEEEGEKEFDEEKYKKEVEDEMKILDLEMDDEVLNETQKKRKEVIKKLQKQFENENSKEKSKDLKIESNLKIEKVPTPPLQIIDDNSNEDIDMFDMFSDDITALPDPTADHAVPENTETSKNTKRSLVEVIYENYDDSEGYYKAKVGEILNMRYKILDIPIGVGVFSNVVKCHDMISNSYVAVKIIRNNEAMKKSGKIEISTLKKITRNAKDSGEFCVNLLDDFMYRNHLCIVYEQMSMNLREIISNFGKDKGKIIGINLTAIRQYATQLLYALKSLEESEIIHADIKPDNILINNTNTIVKLADFGSSFPISENYLTPILQSRFYRAPEVILGGKYGIEIDMWSIGCTLFELFTGKILFKSKNNNEHLRMIMEYKGIFTLKYLKQCEFREDHFDFHGNFLEHELDIDDDEKIILRKKNIKKIKSLKNQLLSQVVNKSVKNRYQVLDFHDLLEKMLVINPKKRITIENALKHTFITNENDFFDQN